MLLSSFFKVSLKITTFNTLNILEKILIKKLLKNSAQNAKFQL